VEGDLGTVAVMGGQSGESVHDCVSVSGNGVTECALWVSYRGRGEYGSVLRLKCLHSMRW